VWDPAAGACHAGEMYNSSCHVAQQCLAAAKAACMDMHKIQIAISQQTSVPVAVGITQQGNQAS